MNKKEKIVITLTTWSARINNIPSVLDSIYSQSLPPDYVVLNLAYSESIPIIVSNYIEDHNIIVNRVQDTKVYKKLFPTLDLFPNDCVISIDDDFIYPSSMIQDFMKCHYSHPNSPISGNRIYFHSYKCHCGCASLTKKEFFGKYFICLDNEVISNCPSDDIVYTYLIHKARRRYVSTKNEYFVNLTPVNPVSPYSVQLTNPEEKSWDYMRNRFGSIHNTTIIYRIINKVYLSYLSQKRKILSSIQLL